MMMGCGGRGWCVLFLCSYLEGIYGLCFIAVPVMHAGQVARQKSARGFSRLYHDPILDEKEAEEALNRFIVLAPLKASSCPKLRRGAGRGPPTVDCKTFGAQELVRQPTKI